MIVTLPRHFFSSPPAIVWNPDLQEMERAVRKNAGQYSKPALKSVRRKGTSLCSGLALPVSCRQVPAKRFGTKKRVGLSVRKTPPDRGGRVLFHRFFPGDRERDFLLKKPALVPVVVGKVRVFFVFHQRFVPSIRGEPSKSNPVTMPDGYFSKSYLVTAKIMPIKKSFPSGFLSEPIPLRKTVPIPKKCGQSRFERGESHGGGNKENPSRGKRCLSTSLRIAFFSRGCFDTPFVAFQGGRKRLMSGNC